MTATCSKRARTPGRTLAVTHSEEASDSNDPEWFPEASPRAAKQQRGHSTTPVSCAARGCGDALPRPAIPHVKLFRRVKSWVPGGWPSMLGGVMVPYSKII